MKRSGCLTVIRLIVIVLFSYTTVFSQSLYKLKESKTGIDNPESIITIKDNFKHTNIKHIIKTNSKLLFLDDSMNITQERKISKARIITSKKNSYFVIDEKKQDLQKDITLIDCSNNEYWKKTFKHNEEDVITFHPTDYNGNVLILNHQNMILTTYSRKGNVINKHQLFGDFSKNPDKRVFVDMSESGVYCVILAEKRFSLENGKHLIRSGKKDTSDGAKLSFEDKLINMKRTDGEPQLFLFDFNGALLKKMNTEEERPVNLFINDDGQYIVYIVEDIDSGDLKYHFALLNNKLETIFKKIISYYPVDILFLDDQLVIAAYDATVDKNFLVAISIVDGNEIWKEELENPTISISGSNNSIEIISQSIQTIDKNAKTSVLFFDFSGKRIDFLEIGELQYIPKIKSVKNITPYINTDYFVKENEIVKLINTKE